jgi:hypothetical protein
MKNLSDNHWTLALGLFRERMSTREAQAAIMAGPYFVRGQSCDLAYELVGPGIYEVWMRERAWPDEAEAGI